MKDIKYIIKRILIGVGIALAIMFIKQNVYAYEWEAQGDQVINYIDNNSNDWFCYYSHYSKFNYSPSYPVTHLSNRDCYTHSQLPKSSSTFGMTGVLGPFLVQGFHVDFGDYVFEPGTYYVIVPFGYTSSMLTSLSNNFDGLDPLDSSTYTSNYGIISSAVLSFGSTNDYQLTSTYPYFLYYKVLFTVESQTSGLTIDIGNTVFDNLTYTAYNTTTYNTYLFKSDFNCTAWSSSYPCFDWNYSAMQPLLYSGTPGSPILDGNDIISDSSSDIKTTILDIIDGHFSENLDFPYMNGGGMSFGDNSYSFQDLLIMPIQFFKNIVDSSVACSPLALPVPGLTGTMYLQCPTTFVTSVLGSTVVDMIKLILGVVVGFKILQALYKSVLNILDPEKLSQIQDIF